MKFKGGREREEEKKKKKGDHPPTIIMITIHATSNERGFRVTSNIITKNNISSPNRDLYATQRARSRPYILEF
jgi:hypothetical protein